MKTHGTVTITFDNLQKIVDLFKKQTTLPEHIYNKYGHFVLKNGKYQIVNDIEEETS